MSRDRHLFSDNVPHLLLPAMSPEPSKRRVISQHDTLEEANASVLWDLERVNAAGRTRVGPPNGTPPEMTKTAPSKPAASITEETGLLGAIRV